ncbi:MAG: DVUA0089 family protein, partial [Cyanobacteria bacterium J06642_11]
AAAVPPRPRVDTIAPVTTLGLGGTAAAADLSFRGTFTQDNDVHLFDFNVADTSTVTLRTYSYGGGTQADGTFITAGGFDPTLSLFDGTGRYINVNDDDESTTVAADPSTGLRYDSLLEVVLNAGKYTLALTQHYNFAMGQNLADGFSQAGNSNFTSNFVRCTTHQLFCDFTGDIRTNQWAFDALGVQPLNAADKDKPPAPEPPAPEPPAPEPPVVEPPVTEPPVSEPPVTEPPVSEPPVSEPPVIEPPVFQPPMIPPIIETPDETPTSVPEPTATVAIALAGMLAMKKRRHNKSDQ